MAERPRKVLICSCDDTMTLDGDAVGRTCRGAEVIEGRQLCRAELERFRSAVADGGDVTVACSQEAPLFVEVAAEIPDAAAMTFVNIRESAGWSKDAKTAGPKIAALSFSSGSNTKANSARSKRPTYTNVPAPCFGASVWAWAKASPNSRRRTAL